MSAKDWLNSLKRRLDTWTDHPEQVYLVIALIGIVGFAFITPPFQGPDEKAHYIRTQYIAHGYVLPVDAKKTGASLPASIETVMEKTYLQDSTTGGLQKYTLHTEYEALKVPLHASETYQPPMISYTALSYIPAIPGVVLANLFGANALISMYIARLSLGIFCILITYLSLRIVPSKKYFFMVVALVPMLLFQQAVVSTDGVSYALLFAFVCYVLYLYQQKSVSNKQWYIICALCIAITLAKPLVFLFLPLILMLIKKQHAVRWIAGIASVCIVLFGGVMLYNGHLTGGVVDPNVPKTVDSAAQMTNIREHPKRFLRVLWNSYMTHYGDEEIQGVIGIFGSADTRYPLWMTFGYIVLLTCFATVQLEKNRTTWLMVGAMKAILVVLIVAYFVAVNVALYLSFSPVNYNIVYGVQGRYFLPIFIMLPVLVTPFLTIRSNVRSRFMRYSCLSLTVLIVLALFITLQRYYLFTP